MADNLPPNVISKPDALDKYQKPERTFQRRLSKALRTRNEAFLSHFYLSTTDGVVRKGVDVAEGDVEQLKGKGLYPVWHVEEKWFVADYDRKSQKKIAGISSNEAGTLGHLSKNVGAAYRRSITMKKSVRTADSIGPPLRGQSKKKRGR